MAHLSSICEAGATEAGAANAAGTRRVAEIGWCRILLTVVRTLTLTQRKREGNGGHSPGEKRGLVFYKGALWLLCCWAEGDKAEVGRVARKL